ncbi:MAG: phytoene synthase [Chlorobi bacterium OLB7]|nr:MAG: phytoene synthase [Chlorobi bacterium OLB7]
MMEAIADSYQFCRLVTLRHAKTFYFASRFLSHNKRNACYAVYAFCRYVDDLIDQQVAHSGGIADGAAIQRTIAQWQCDLDRVYAGDSGATPVMVAWGDTLRRYNISRNLPDELIEGVMMDLRPAVRYRTFDELYTYCYKVASVVGLMTSEIFRYSNPAALNHAVDLGIAMQLTNILRDVGEDWRMNRIYLPQQELQAFGLDDNAVARGKVTLEFRRLMEFQIERANSYYRSAQRGIRMLEPDSRLTVTLMSHNYQGILEAIRRNNYNVFTQRASVPLPRKLLSVPKLLVRHPITAAPHRSAASGCALAAAPTQSGLITGL